MYYNVKMLLCAGVKIRIMSSLENYQKVPVTNPFYIDISNSQYFAIYAIAHTADPSF